MTEPIAFNRDDYVIEILSELADDKQYEGHQIGPEHTLEQIAVIRDLIDEGYAAGQATPGQDGRIVNIGFPRITPTGREHLKNLKAAREAQWPVVRARAFSQKAIPAVFKWIATIGAAVLGAWLIKRFGLK